MKKLTFSLLLMTSLTIPPARAIIPFNQALDVFEETKEDHKAISPFWGLVALHGKLLEQIRFFGPYGELSADNETKELQELFIHPSLLLKNNPSVNIREYPLNAIAALIQHLFLCPDGVQFVANTRNQDPVGNLSRHLDKINDLIQILCDCKSAEEKKNKIVTTVLKPLDKNTKTKFNETFANILVDAYQQQEVLANPNLPTQQLYPENIVIISLLTFFCQIADNHSDFDKLSFLMKMDNHPQHIFTKNKYSIMRNHTKNILDRIVSDHLHPELAFLMGKGYEIYENYAADPIPYRGDVSYQTSPTFPDCGETSLRNVLMLLLEDQGNIPEAFLKILQSKIIPLPEVNIQDHNLPFQQMISYFHNHSSLSDASTKEAHDDWAQVVSDLNNANTDYTLEDVQYGRGLKGQKYTYEIKANHSTLGVIGLINMLNVIAKIIPDQQLNIAWSNNERARYQQAQKKLSRLCELLSREGREISWENKDTKDQQITDAFMTLTLIINREKAYDWRFTKGHFQLDPLRNASNDWRLAYKDYPFTNNWISSIFRRLNYFAHENPSIYQSNLSLDLIYNRSLKRVDGTLEAIAMILDGNIKSFYPMISRWIQKSIPLNDPEAFSKLALLLYGFQDHSYVSALPIPDIHTEINKVHQTLQESLFKASAEGYLQTVAKLVENGAKINAPDNNGLTPLHWAAKHGHAALIKFLLDHGAQINEINKHKETPLHLASQAGHESVVKILIERGAQINCKNNIGETPLHQSVQESHPSVIKLLLSKGAPLNVKDHCGFTPIHWAKRVRSQNIIALLLHQLS